MIELDVDQFGSVFYVASESTRARQERERMLPSDGRTPPETAQGTWHRGVAVRRWKATAPPAGAAKQSSHEEVHIDLLLWRAVCDEPADSTSMSEIM